MRVQNNKLKSKKKYTASSRSWLLRHLNDQYVQSAKRDGYRSRASYKLLQIQEKFGVLKLGDIVVDLGAAPGGWSQVANTIVGNFSSRVIAVDLLKIDPIPGVTILQGNFCDEQIVQQLMIHADKKVNIVLSDMAPNTTGHPSLDHLKIMDLCEQAYSFAIKVLAVGGYFVCKVFQGGTHDSLLAEIKKNFVKVKHFKPAASRAVSSELYLVALGFKGANYHA